MGAAILVGGIRFLAARPQPQPPLDDKKLAIARLRLPPPQPLVSADRQRPPEEEPKAGKLELGATPPAEVYLGKKLLGRTPGAFSLPPGKHALRLVNKDLGLEQELDVDVTEGQTVKTEVSFKKGWLLIRASPWAEVRLDGKALGTTPIPAQEVYEGSHLVELSNSDLGKSKRLTVKVAPGEHKTVREALE